MIARSAAERLAAQTGGTIEQGEGGLRTVHFPAPEIPGSRRSSRTRSRASSATRLPGASPAPSGVHGASTHPAEAGGQAMDPETMYEYFLDRFKRDLLIEREQLGHLIIDNP